MQQRLPNNMMTAWCDYLSAAILSGLGAWGDSCVRLPWPSFPSGSGSLSSRQAHCVRHPASIFRRRHAASGTLRGASNDQVVQRHAFPEASVLRNPLVRKLGLRERLPRKGAFPNSSAMLLPVHTYVSLDAA